LVETAIDDVIDCVAQLHFVFQCDFFLVHFFNFVEELAFPAVKFDAFDVVEGLIDVAHALVVLFAPLLLHVTLFASSDVANQELSHGEDDNNEAIPSDCLESEIAGNDQIEWAFDVVRHRPDECPHAPSLTHDDRTNLTFTEVFIGRVAHSQVFLEKHGF